jgi:iron complex outermembrane receptor protein
LKYQFLVGVESSTSSRKSQLLPTMDIQNVAQAGVPGSTDVKRGQASINIHRFNKTFEHTLNYNNDLSDNFNLDALVGYSYYDYTADGSFHLERL